MTTITCNDPASRDDTFLAWLLEHGLDPSFIHTVHIDSEAAEMKIEGYAQDALGRKYVDEAKKAAEFRPFIVDLKSPTPSGIIA